MQLVLHDVTRGGADYTRLYIRRSKNWCVLKEFTISWFFRFGLHCCKFYTGRIDTAAKDMGFESQRVLWLIWFSFASLSTQRCTCASQGMFSHRYSHSTIYGSAHCSLSSYFLVSLHRPMHSSLVELRCYRHISTDQLYLHFTIHFLLQWESRGVFVLLPKQQQNHWWEGNHSYPSAVGRYGWKLPHC